jgi:hypothetical protein
MVLLHNLQVRKTPLDFDRTSTSMNFLQAGQIMTSVLTEKVMNYEIRISFCSFWINGHCQIAIK